MVEFLRFPAQRRRSALGTIERYRFVLYCPDHPCVNTYETIPFRLFTSRRGCAKPLKLLRLFSRSAATRRRNRKNVKVRHGQRTGGEKADSEPAIAAQFEGHVPTGSTLDERIAKLGVALMQWVLAGDIVAVMRLGISEARWLPDLAINVHLAARRRSE